MQDQQTTAPAPLITSVDFTATKLDGTSETVKIRQLPVSQFPKYSQCLESEPALIELATDQKPGWSDTLTPESFEAIISKVEEVNGDAFGRWVQRRIARQEKLFPGVTEKVLKNATSV